MSNPRRIYLRIFLTILVGSGIALALAYAFVAANGASSRSLLGRVIEAQEAIPRIAAEDKDLVLVFGSSMVHAGFSPREFDQVVNAAGGNVMSLNFGAGGLNPLFQDYTSRRIADTFRAEDRRLKLVLVEFNPFQATKARRELQRAQEESYLALMTSPRELWDMVLDDPESGIRMAEIRYLRDGISAEMITTFFWATPFQAPRDAGLDIQEEEGVEERLGEVLEKMGEKFEEEYPDYDGSEWYYPWQGGGTIKAERSAETLALVEEYYELTQTDYRMTVDRLNRIQSADIENLVFDPELVAHFIRVVENLKEIADNVEVIMLPKNTDWIKNPPEALERQAAVVAQIEAATGVPVRDFQQIDAVTNDMFSDTTHLNRYHGAKAFSEFLAAYYTDLLQ